MSNNNHIDDIFKKGLANYSEEPPKGLWEKISQDNKGKRPLIPGLLTKIIVVSVIVLFVTVSAIGYLIYKTKEEKNNTIAHQNEAPVEEAITKIKTKNTPFTNVHEPVSGTDAQVIQQTIQIAETTKETFNYKPDKSNEEIQSSIIVSPELKKEQIITPELVKHKPTQQALTEETVELEDIQEEMTKNEETEVSLLPNVPDELSKKSKTHNGTFHLGVYGSVSHTSKSMYAAHQDYADFINWRQSNEKPLIISDYGLLLNFNKGAFLIQTGIGRMTLGERNNYNYNAVNAIDSSDSYYDYYINTYPDPNNPNNTIVVTDSVWVLVSDTIFQNTINNHKNTITYISIPLNIGYKLQNGNHGVSIISGISFARLIAQNTSYPHFDKNDFVYTEIAGTPYRKNIFSLQAAIAYTYSLNPYTELFIQPHFRQSLTNIYEDNYPLNKKYRQYGLMLGLYYKIK